MKNTMNSCREQVQLPCDIILSIVQDIIEEFDLPSIPAESIREACMPSGFGVFVHNDNGSIWVDCEYIAWEPVGQAICYAYVTRSHIQSERRCFREVSRERHADIRLPNDIEKAFSRAEKEMSNYDTYWVDDFYRELLNIPKEKRS